MVPSLRSFHDTARGLGERARTVARVARRSGLAAELTGPGVLAILSEVARGSRNPSRIFRIHAANNPHKPALLWRDRRLTFADLDARIQLVAAAARGRGWGRGSNVLLVMRNRPEFVELLMGVARAGGGAVSVSWRSTGPELAYVAANCGAKAIVFEADLLPAVDHARRLLPSDQARAFIAVGGDAPGCVSYERAFLGSGPQRRRAAERADESAFIVYTSGTTGKPKGAVRRFSKEGRASVLRFLAETPLRTDDVHLVACPLYHTTALGFFTMSAMLGATSVLLEEFKPEAFFALAARHRVTTTAVVPTMLHRLVSVDAAHRPDPWPRSFRAIFSTGAPLPGPLASEAMDRFGDVLFNVYGSTETGLVTLANPADLRAAPGTIGRPIPGNELRLVDEAGRFEGVAHGELFVRSGMLVTGYHDDPDSTRASTRDGFFTVGDVARRDGAGLYYIEGRRGDMIISGGVNVYPAEVEAALEAHPAVAEAAVVGVEDADLGERVCAFVVARSAAQALDEAALRSHCRERLSGAKVPRDFVFLDALPRNPTGKVLKRELRMRGLGRIS